MLFSPVVVEELYGYLYRIDCLLPASAGGPLGYGYAAKASAVELLSVQARVGDPAFPGE